MMKEQCCEIFSKNQEEIQKKVLGDIRKGYFVWRKEIFFSIE